MCPGYFSAVGTQWSFSDITVAKPSFANDFPNVICITNCKPRYSKSELVVFQIMGKTLLSVKAKIGSLVLLRQFQMTLACL